MVKQFAMAVMLLSLSASLLCAQTGGNNPAESKPSLKMGLPIDNSEDIVDVKVSLDKDGNRVQTLTLGDGSTITITVQKDGKSAEVLESNGMKHLLDMSNPKKMTIRSHNKSGDAYGYTIIEDTGRIVTRELKPDKSLEVVVVDLKTETPTLHQVWRHDPSVVGKNGKQKPYVLQSVDEFDRGTPTRHLQFHDNGTIKKSQTFHKGGSSSVVNVDDQGFITSTEEIGAAGQRHSLPAPRGKIKHQEPDYSKLILDPVIGKSEPIGVDGN